MCPSAPSYPPERRSAQRPVSRREYEGYDWYEEFLFTIPAGTAFVEAGRFSGRPDKIIARCNASSQEIRLRRQGEAPGSTIRLRIAEPLTIPTGAEIVEARDPSGAGAGVIFVTALFSSRAIDIRDNRPGPVREEQLLEVDSLAAQVQVTR